MSAPDADPTARDADPAPDDPTASPASPSGTEAPGATRPERPTPGSRREIPWRLVALGALLVYGILFVILNSKEVSVSFVFFTPRVSLIVALVLALLIGFLAGYLFDTVRDRKRREGTPKTPPGKT